jgi:hypothetical protein
MTKIIKGFQQFLKENIDTTDNSDDAELRDMGFYKKIDWEVELEIEFSQASQSEPDYIKSVFIGWLPEINSDKSEFEVHEDSVDIDEWTEEDYLTQDDEIPTDDDIDQMRKPKLLDLIQELDLEVDTDDATKTALGELRDLVKLAIEDHGFGEMNYGQRNFIRFTLSTVTDNENDVSAWIDTTILGSGRVFNSIENLERVN